MVRCQAVGRALLLVVKLSLRSGAKTCKQRHTMGPTDYTHIRPALCGGMDWWRREWSFSRVRKYFPEAEVSRKMPEIPQKERFSPKFRLRNLKIQSPKNCNSTPPILPIDSLLHTHTHTHTRTYVYCLGISLPITQDICYTGLPGRNYYV